MSEPAVIFAVDHGAESCGPILPILARLLVEIDAKRNTNEPQRWNRPTVQEPGGSPQKMEVTA